MKITLTISEGQAARLLEAEEANRQRIISAISALQKELADSDEIIKQIKTEVSPVKKMNTAPSLFSGGGDPVQSYSTKFSWWEKGRYVLQSTQSKHLSIIEILNAIYAVEPTLKIDGTYRLHQSNLSVAMGFKAKKGSVFTRYLVDGEYKYALLDKTKGS